VTITGNVTGGSAAHGLYHSAGAVVTGTVTGGSGSASYGIYTTSGEATVLGDLHASAYASAISTYQNTKAQHLNGNEFDHAEGWTAISVGRRVLGTHIGSVHRIALDGQGGFVTRSVDPDHADPSDVRHGTAYASGTLVGTCHVPPSTSVAAGTPVDDTVGAAVLTGAQIPSAADIAAAVRSNLEVELSRVANCATVASTGEQIAAFESA
jgi:hypothetical protein